jgi:hypothetical protein
MPGRNAVRRALAAVLVVAALGIAALAPGAPPRSPRRLASPDSFPTGPGREVAERACMICHSPMLVTQQAKDSTGWEKTLTLMEQWGAPVAPAERAMLRGYLLANFGPRPTAH